MSQIYLEHAATDRAAHIWRYTTWEKAHPTGKVDVFPSSTSPKISISQIDGNPAPSGVSIGEASTSDLERLGHDLDFDDGTAAPTFIAALADSVSILTIEDKTKLQSP